MVFHICNNNRAGDNNHDHNNDNSNIKYRVQQYYNNIFNNNEDNKYTNNVGILNCGYNVNTTTNHNGHRMSVAMLYMTHLCCFSLGERNRICKFDPVPCPVSNKGCTFGP